MSRMYPILGGCILAWAVFSMLAIALQCGTSSPEVYRPNRCMNGALWYPVTALNCLTDAALAFSFAPVVVQLVMSRGQKIKVIVLFSTRIL